MTVMRAVFFLLLGSLLLVPSGTPSAQEADSSDEETVETSRPPVQLLRQDERWGPWAKGREGLASLKFIPLGRNGTPFLTLGGEARSYGRLYRNERWGNGPAEDAYLLQRLMVHGALQTDLGPESAHFRVFAQLKSGTVADRKGPVYPPDKDLLGVNQAFLEAQSRVGPDGDLTVRVGRQELHYGTGRMIAVRDGPNVRLGFDAVLARYERGSWRADAFAATPTETAPGILDNGWIHGRTLWGTHLRRRKGREEVSLYYFGTDRTAAPVGNGLHVTRHTIGGRVQGTTDALTYVLNGAVQFGRFDRASSPIGAEGPDRGRVHASRFAGRLSYQVPPVLGAPRIGLMADWSSGDIEGTGAHETFVAPYPSGHFTGAGSRLGPSNLITGGPFLTLRPQDEIRLRLNSHFFWRPRSGDGVYAIWGAPLRPASDTGAQFIGVMPEAVLSADVSRPLLLALEASYFNAGPVLRESGAGRDMTHLGLRVRYAF